MAGHVLKLRGCTPEPLGNYLKGLGAFRLIAEQADPLAKAWWRDGVLCLHTKWSVDEVVSFFSNGIGEGKAPIYSPTPIFAPWGGRPGFFDDGNEKAKARLEILRSLAPPGRFSPSQRAIKITDDILKSHGWTALSKKKRAEIKPEIISSMRTGWQSSAVHWFDACLSLQEDARFGFLYGTGGNEGSADITNNFWELIEEVFGLAAPKPVTGELLAAALFGEPRVGGTGKTVGQHFPLAAGSSNCGQTFEGSSSANPWDFILMMEGAVLFAGATTKRLSQEGKGKAAFPFMIDHLSTGEPATSIKEEASQDRQVTRCRAEFWMPLWHSPVSLSGIRGLLSEGRLQRGSGQQTEHTLHAMEAIQTLGVSRGVGTFHRVALFERRGKGYYLASSMGYHATSRSSESVTTQLGEIDRFRQQVYQNLREGPGIPQRVMQARHQFHAALARALEPDHQASLSSALIDILVNAAVVEREVALLRDRMQVLTPCPPLSTDWLSLEDCGAEYDLARAVASIAPWGEITADGQYYPAVQALRSNLLPVARRGHSWVWDHTTRSCVWSRTSQLAADFSAVVRRRLIDSQRGSGDGLPLWSSHGAKFESLLAFWHGTVDELRIAKLIHGVSLIGTDLNQCSTLARQSTAEPTPNLQTGDVWFGHRSLEPIRWRGRELLDRIDLQGAFELPRVYHLLKLCFVAGRLPRRPEEGSTVERSGNEPFPPVCMDVLALLEAGRLPEAAQTAARRLRAKGYPTVLRDSELQELDLDPKQCRRLAGMMLIPVRQPGVLAALAIKPAKST